MVVNALRNLGAKKLKMVATISEMRNHFGCAALPKTGRAKARATRRATGRARFLRRGHLSTEVKLLQMLAHHKASLVLYEKFFK